MKESIFILCVLLMVSTSLLIRTLNKHVKITNGSQCIVIDTASELKYLVDKNPKVIKCEGECHINYKQTALNAFAEYGNEFILLYCGEDRNMFSSNGEGVSYEFR